MAASYLAVITLTIAFTFLFATAIATVDVESIKADWPNRRCEVPAMLAASWFKPDNDPREPNAFAQDNFNFCMKKVVDEVLKTAFAPLMGVTQQQLNAQESLQGPVNNVRGMLKTAKDQFGELMNEQYRKFSFIGIQASRIWLHLQFAMNRMGAIVTSIVYLGLSIMATIQNLIDFTMLVIYIFIGLMVVLVILLWFVMFPFIPLILTVITILVGAGIGGAASMAGAFCVDPDANVVMANHTLKPLKEVQLGDVLLGDGEIPNIVSGILTADASKEPLVEIHGIVMSGSHRVLHNQVWILAKDHPNAIASDKHLQSVICLNTIQHKVYIRGAKGNIGVGDWEEVTTDAGQRAWIDFVHMKLNGGHHRIPEYPTTVPIVSPTAKVFKRDLGWVPVSAIRIGDFVKCEGNYTKVLGIYQGEIPTEVQPQGDWISDGMWIRIVRWWSTARQGVKATEYEPHHIVQGLNLITEAEMFSLRVGEKEMLVRDFTELGVSNLESSYSMLDLFINKK